MIMEQKYLLTYEQNGNDKYSWFDTQEELAEFAIKLEEFGYKVNEALYLPEANEIEW